MFRKIVALDVFMIILGLALPLGRNFGIWVSNTVILGLWGVVLLFGLLSVVIYFFSQEQSSEQQA
jgi:hypothetical protein